MRAWLLHDTNGPGSFVLEDVPAPEPGPGEVRVGLKVAALNHLDLWVSMGLPRPSHFPHIAGADGAGVVDAVGEGVTEPAVGAEVVVNPSTSCGRCLDCLDGNIVYCRSYAILGEHLPGTLAEQVVLPATSAVRKPAGLDWETAGSFGLATATAYRMLRRARLRAGETLLVVGVGGGVSSAALLLGRAMGARVLVTSRSPEKIAWALAHGAEAGFASGGGFAKEVREATGGRGVDVVAENVGPATWDQSIRSLRTGGRIVVCGSTSGTKVELTVPVLFFKHLDILGSTMFTHGEFAETLALVASGAVRPPVDRVFALEDLPAALARLESGAQLGKVALRVS
jgi:NADPH:quinone reductase-like Zn-dependent oxidoreductase